MFKRTTAVNKLLSLDNRIRIVPGGTWAGKTYDIIAIEIDYLIKNANTETTVVAETIPAIKSGALKDFKGIMRDTNRFNPDRYNATERIYTFFNNSSIQFTSFDSSDKARQAGKRNRLFVNEVNTISKDIVDSLIIRTDGVVWLDYNPTARFWVNDEFENHDEVDWLTLTYRDNEALPDTVLQELHNRREKAKTSKYWKNWCDVYLDGKTGSFEGVCIPDWEEIELPEEARLLCYGLDWGYSNDPTTCIGVYEYNGGYIFDEVFYKKGLSNSDISNLLKQQVEDEIIWADSAEPKSIAELSAYGHLIEPAPKGRDSIMYGINLLNQNKIYITRRSENIKRELRSYTFMTSKTGEKINKPIDAFNHTIDSMRYALMGQLENPTKGQYFIH
jgi:phage terminase large subunit